MVYNKDKRLLEFDEEIASVDEEIEASSNGEIDSNEVDNSDYDEKLDLVEEEDDEDAGFELDDSGMIPMLEELKALGNDNSADKDKFIDNEEKFLEEKPVLNLDFEDESEEVTRKLEIMSYDNSDDLLEDDDVLMDSFDKNEIIEKNTPDEKTVDDYESMYNFNYLDQLDDDLDIDKQTVFAEDDFLTDASDVKVKFYDDTNISDSTNLLEALDKIADKSEVLDELERLSDNTEALDLIEEGLDDFQDYLKTMKRIANSLERIADSLEKKDI